MGESDIVKDILDFVPDINFTTTKNEDEKVSVFESNIRYLGGLLSGMPQLFRDHHLLLLQMLTPGILGYDLLKDGDLAVDDDKVDALLEQAKSLADSLRIAFDTKSGVPAGDVILNPSPRRADSGRNSIAGFGTLVLEWVRLSDLTGDDDYAKVALKAQQYLIEPTGKPEAFPGLVGYQVSTETGEFLDSSGGWSGGTDSFYEYLIKMYLYDPDSFKTYKDRWVLAADSTIEHLASHPSSKPGLTFLAGYSGQRISTGSGHCKFCCPLVVGKFHGVLTPLSVASFAGGNFILGGILLKEQKYIDFGIELAESYYATYRATASGIGPEGFSWIDSTRGSGAPPDDQADFYNKSGFWISSSPYILRPETMESLYYAYRVTGDSKYQDLAWEGFQNIRDKCRAGVGYSGIQNVNDPSGGSLDDFQQSFWLAETLKYLYLIFTPDSPVHVEADEKNSYVFNTEAHPLRVRN